MNAREQFSAGATRSATTCMIGYNNYGQRHKNVHLGIPCAKYPRCDKEETWEQVVQCETLRYKNETFVE